MHQIFTRVFLSFWAAIVLIAAAAVAITAINFRAHERDPFAVTAEAAKILQHKGLPALRTWLQERNLRVHGQRTLIIDSTGRDILGQRLPRHRRPPPPPFDFGGPPPGAERGAPPFNERGTLAIEPDDSVTAPGSVERNMGPEVRRRPLHFPGAAARGFGPPLEFLPPGALIRAANGATYRVLFHPPPHRGPFSPPFSWPVRGLLLLLAIAISGLISYWLARSISAPLQNLQSATRMLSTGALSARADAKVARRQDEFGVLAREFNSMAERLSALISARQRLLRDISHELRSPLARLQMALQLLRQDSTSTQSQLDRIEREAERLEKLVDQVLEYARLERDGSLLDLEEVDLIELVRQIVHDAAFESQSAPGRLTFTHPDEVLMRADPNLLHAVIDNVVRNALIHAGGQAAIEISVSTAAEQVTIQVRDHGRGVPEGELQKIFEPFYRVVDAASSTARNEGSGIGLALAARAVALHRGTITAQNAPGGGLTITISLPT